MHYQSTFQLPKGIIYLDSAATTQKPSVVIEGISSFYTHSYANVHRGLYPLAVEATTLFEAARETVKKFIDASSVKEVIFTHGATEALNLLAFSLTETLNPGDEIILSILEHHANLIPWQQAANRHNLQLKFVNSTKTGEIDLNHFKTLITPQTKVVSLSHCSNVLGTILPSIEIKKILYERGSAAYFILDASQSVAHIPLSVQELGCDYLVFSGHKVYGPSGIGILWGSEALLESLQPYQTGGDMLSSATLTQAAWNTLPWKFEAGTQNLEGAIGLGAALTFLQEIGMDNVQKHTEELTQHTIDQLQKISFASLLSSPHPASGIISFTVDGVHPHDLAELLGQEGICIRAGHHCAMPLHTSLGLTASNRISIGLYNTKDDIDRCVSTISQIHQEVTNA